MKVFFKSVSIMFLLSVNLYTKDIVDIDNILHIAKENNKKIMIFCHIPNCRYCNSMLNENFKNKTILNYIKKDFILVDIYTKDDQFVKFNGIKATQKSFLNYIEVTAFPATIFMDENGKIVYKTIGYRNIDEYLVDIKYVVTNSYDKMDIETFQINLEMDE